MFAAKLVTEEWEVNKRLRDFGVSRAELIDIIRGVVGARSDATVDDPVTAGGLFAYIFGTRYIRQLFKARGWFQHREDNVESVKHPDRNLKIVYQSVDWRLKSDRILRLSLAKAQVPIGLFFLAKVNYLTVISSMR
jgi:hypothetical protein